MSRQAVYTTVKQPTEQETMINRMYDAQQSANEANLKSAYETALSNYKASAEKIVPQYRQSANDLSTQYERARQAFQRQAAASGLNTGTGAQEALARAGQYQRDFGALRRSENEALAENRRQQDVLTAEYKNKVAAALAQGDQQRAAALLDEYNNAYTRDTEKAKALAEYGDFSGYRSLYGDKVANSMFNIWAAQNPQLAYMSGAITEAQYNNLIAGLPMNYVGAANTGGGSSGGGIEWNSKAQALVDAVHAAGGYYDGYSYVTPDSNASEGMSAHKGIGAG